MLDPQYLLGDRARGGRKKAPASGAACRGFEAWLDGRR